MLSKHIQETMRRVRDLGTIQGDTWSDVIGMATQEQALVKRGHRYAEQDQITPETID